MGVCLKIDVTLDGSGFSQVPFYMLENPDRKLLMFSSTNSFRLSTCKCSLHYSESASGV